MDIERVKKEMKKKHHQSSEKDTPRKTTIIKKNHQKKITSFMIRLSLCMIITLLCFILYVCTPVE